MSRSADAEDVIGCGRPVDRQDPKVRRPVPLAHGLGDTDIDQETLQPRVETVRIAEAPQVTPGDHQRVLEGILGPIDIAKDPLRDREEPVCPSTDQVDVRFPIPAPCRLDEVAIHGSHLLSAALDERLSNLLVDVALSPFILRLAILRRVGLHAQGGTTCTSGSSSRT